MEKQLLKKKKRGQKKINGTAESLSSRRAGETVFFFFFFSKTIVNFTRYIGKKKIARNFRSLQAESFAALLANLFFDQTYAFGRSAFA